MNYEEKYKDLLKRLKNAKEDNHFNDERYCCVIDEIVLELAESEDEKIRKELIDAINGLWDNDALPMPLTVKRKDNWLAWIEKQCNSVEQKYNPYEATIRSIAEMCGRYSNGSDLKDFYDNVKVKCKESIEFGQICKPKFNVDDTKNRGTMERREQIIDFAENTLKLEKESPELVKFIQGATWADAHPINYDGKAMLHVLNKGHKQGYKDAIEKTCEWLKDNVEIYFDIDGNEPIIDVADLLKDFERDMKGQQ